MKDPNTEFRQGWPSMAPVGTRFSWAEFGEAELKPTSTVLITGDARSNYQPAQSAVLGQIAKRARLVYWLNPEASSKWNEFDSEMDDYGEHCTRMFEVRNLDQLTHCVEQTL